MAMTKAAKRARSHRRAVAKGEERAAERKTPPKPKASGTPLHSQNGLEWLTMKGRLKRDQRKAGEAYGLRYRLSQIEGADSLRSCLDLSPRGGTGIPSTPAESAAWIAEGKRQLADARAVLSHHVGMMAVCDLVCGRGFTPREITQDQREADEIETTLRLALDLICAAKPFSDQRLNTSG